ncbi:hypothetical protein PG993_007384 [Apiospora rasikravindrae]|uniref:Uncharacterized protein n=1 Tax=Apiospora rasikravindrae TaxID=990691 RepID=A0ABR1SZK9_9PEZI
MHRRAPVQRLALLDVQPREPQRPGLVAVPQPEQDAPGRERRVHVLEVAQVTGFVSQPLRALREVGGPQCVDLGVVVGARADGHHVLHEFLPAAGLASLGGGAVGGAEMGLQEPLVVGPEGGFDVFGA